MDTAEYLYRHVIPNEVTCVAYLKERGLLPNPETCSRMRNDKICGGKLKECLKKSRKTDSNGDIIMTVFLKCAKKGCQTYHSIRKNNDFFTSKDKNGKCNSGLSLCEIVELVWYWVFQTPMRQTERCTKRSRHTIGFWNNLCKDVCIAKYDKREKLGGPDTTVQIVETPFMKATKPRVPRKPRTRNNYSDTEMDTDVFNSRTTKQEPWIICLGVTHHNGAILERRFYAVDRRDEDCLIQIILNEIEPGTVVITEERDEYLSLADYGYEHRTVNNCEFFINPETGVEVESMVKLWQHIKSKYTIKVHDSNEKVNRNLKEEWWRSISTGDLFEAFLQDLKAHE